MLEMNTDIHARHYPSDYAAPWGYQSQHVRPGGPSYRDRGTYSNVNHEFRHYKKVDIIHEINQLKQENVDLASQLNVKEDFNGHADILDEVNRLRLMNMRLKLFQTKQQRWKDTADVVKTNPAHLNNDAFTTNTSAREHSRTPPQQRYSEPHDGRKHEVCEDPISTKDIFDRVDKLESDVRKVLKKYCHTKRHRHRDNATIVHHDTVSRIAARNTDDTVDQNAVFHTAGKGTGKTIDQHNVAETAIRHITTAASVDSEAEAKRIIAQYHKSKERRRSEITHESSKRSSVDKQVPVRRRQAGQQLSPYNPEGQRSEIGRHISMAMDSQQGQAKSQNHMNSRNQDQLSKQRLRKNDPRQLKSESKQQGFHSQISSANTSRSEYTGKQTEEHGKFGNYAATNFQHIDEPIRKPQVRFHEERSRLSNSEDTNTNSFRGQDDHGCMLLIVRPTRSQSGTVVGYDVAEDVPRKTKGTNDELQPRQLIESLPLREFNTDRKSGRNRVDEMGYESRLVQAFNPMSNSSTNISAVPAENFIIKGVTLESVDAQRHMEQEIPLTFRAPFKSVLPTYGGKSITEVKHDESVDISMTRAWRYTDEDSMLSNEEPNFIVQSTQICDIDIVPVTYDEPDVQTLSINTCEGDVVSDACKEPTLYATSTQISDADIVPLTGEQRECHGPSTWVCDRDIESVENVTDEETYCNALSRQVCGIDIESVTEEALDDRIPTAPICNMDSINEEPSFRALYTQVCNGDSEPVIDEGSGCRRQVCDTDIVSVTDEAPECRPPNTLVCDLDIVSVTDEAPECRPPNTLVCDLDIISVTDEASECRPPNTRVRDLDIASVTDKEPECRPPNTLVCDLDFVSLTDEEPECRPSNTLEGDLDIVSVTDEAPECRPPNTHVRDLDFVSLTDEEPECRPSNTRVRDLDIVSLTDEEPECRPPNTLVRDLDIVSLTDEEPECRPSNTRVCDLDFVSVTDEEPECRPPNTLVCDLDIISLTEEEPDCHALSTEVGNLEINEVDDISAKGPTIFPSADQKHEHNFGFPVPDSGDSFPARVVELTPVSRFHASDSDSSCIDWSDDEKHPANTDNCVVSDNQKMYSDDKKKNRLASCVSNEEAKIEEIRPDLSAYSLHQRQNDCATMSKKEVENVTLYSDWDKDSDDDEDRKGRTTLKKDVQDILMLHENHKRWASTADPDIAKGNSSVTAISDHGQSDLVLNITSTKDKPAQKDDVLDIVGNLTSGSDWDSDDSEKPKINVSKGNHTPVQGECSTYPVQNNVPKEGTRPVKRKKEKRDSDWDSESEISDDSTNQKIYRDPETENEMVLDHVQEVESDQVLNITSSKNKPAENGAVLDIVGNLTSGSDWDSDESEKPKMNVSKRNHSPAQGACSTDLGQNNFPKKGTVQVKRKKEKRDSDWDSESEISGDVSTNQKIYRDPETEKETVSDHVQDAGNPKLALNAHNLNNGQETSVVNNASSGKGHISASDSDWDSDSGSLFEEKRKTTVKLDLSVTGEIHNRWASTADPDITKGKPAPIIASVTDISDHGQSDQVLNITSSKDKPAEKDDVLDIVGNLTSGSDWDSDEPEKPKINVSNGKCSPIPGACSADVGQNNFLKKGTRPVKRKKEKRDSDWDSESEISGDDTTNQKIYRDPETETDVVSYHAEDAGNPKLALNTSTHNLNNEQESSVVNNASSVKGNISASDSDWDSDSGSLFEEKRKIPVKLDQSVTGELYNRWASNVDPDITKGKPAPIIASVTDISDHGQSNQVLNTTSSKDKPPEKDDVLDIVGNLASDSDWDSDEAEKSKINVSNGNYSDHELDVATLSLGAFNTDVGQNNFPKEGTGPVKRKKEKRDSDWDSESEISGDDSASDSEWDSDIGSTREEKRKTPVELDLSLTDILMAKDDQRQQSSDIVRKFEEKEDYAIAPLETTATKEAPEDAENLASGSDWDSEDSESNKPKNILCKEMQTSKQDHRIKESDVISEITDDNHIARTNNAISNHSSITGSHSNILIEHKMQAEKTLIKDKTSKEEPRRGSDSDWDSDNDPLEDQASVQVTKRERENDFSINMSMSHDDKRRQLANFAVSDIEEKAFSNDPLAIVIADHDSTVESTNGIHTVHLSREEKPVTTDELLDMVQDFNSDADWDSDGGSEPEKPKSSSCNAKDSPPHDMSMAHDDQRRQLANFAVSDIEEKPFPNVSLATVIADHDSTLEPTNGLHTVHQSREEKPVTTDELLDMVQDFVWDSDGESESAKPKSSCCNTKDSPRHDLSMPHGDQKRKLASHVVSDIEEKAFSNDPLATVIADHDSTVEPTNGIHTVHQSREENHVTTLSTDELLDMVQDFVWDSDGESEPEKPESSSCNAKDSPLQDISMPDDDQRRKLANFVVSDIEENVPSATVIADHDSTFESTNGIHKVHQSREEKPVTTDELLDMVQDFDSDCDWDSDGGSESEKPKTSSCNAKDSPPHDVSMAHDDQRRQLANFVVSDVEENVPLAILVADHDSTFESTNGIHTVHLSREEKPVTTDELLDMVQDFDSDADWDSDGEIESEKPESSTCNAKDSPPHDMSMSHDDKRRQLANFAVSDIEEKAFSNDPLAIMIADHDSTVEPTNGIHKVHQSREEKLLTTDELLDMVQDFDSDADWDSDGRGSESEKPKSSSCNAKDSPLHDMLMSQDDQKRQLANFAVSDMEEEASPSVPLATVIADNDSTVEPTNGINKVHQSREENHVTTLSTDELLDMVQDFDSDTDLDSDGGSEPEKPESSSCNAKDSPLQDISMPDDDQRRKLANFVVSDIEENVPSATVIADHDSTFESTNGIHKVHQSREEKPVTTDELLDMVQDFDSDCDWDSDGGSESEKPKTSSCNAKDSPPHDVSMAHDDQRRQLANFVVSDVEENVPLAILVADHDSTFESTNGIHTVHLSREEKPVTTDELLDMVQDFDSDADWDSDGEIESEKPESSTCNAKDSPPHDMSMSHDDKRRQLANFAVSDIEEKAFSNDPLAIMIADHDSTVEPTNGIHKVHQSREEKLLTTDELLDMVQDFDSDADWDSDGRGSESEKPKSSSCNAKDSPLHDMLMSQDDQKRQLANFAVSDMEEEASPSVPLATVIADNDSTVEPTNGINKVHQSREENHVTTLSTDELLDMVQDFDSDTDLDSDGGSEPEKPESSSCNAKDSPLQDNLDLVANQKSVYDDISMPDDDQRRQLANFVVSDVEENVPSAIVIADHDSIVESTNGIHKVHLSREEKLLTTDELLDMVQDFDSDADWDSDGRGSESEKPKSSSCNAKDSPLHDMLMSQDDQKRQLANFAVSDMEEEASPSVPLAIVIADNDSTVEPTNGINKVHQSREENHVTTLSTDELLDMVQDFDSDTDLDSDGGSEPEKPESSRCNAKDSPLQDISMPDDDQRRQLANFVVSDVEENVPLAIVVADHDSTFESTNGIHTVHLSREEKPVTTDELLDMVQDFDVDADWDSDGGSESEKPKSSSCNAKDSPPHDVSMAHDDQRRQLANFAVSDIEENALLNDPFAIVIVDDDSTVEPTNGLRKVHQSREEKPVTTDELLDMVQDFDSDVDWESEGGGSESGKPKSSCCKVEDSPVHDFRGYTSSDEDKNTRGDHKVEVVPSGGKTGVQENKILIPDSSGVCEMNEDCVSNFIPYAGYSDMPCENEELDIVDDVMPTDKCGTVKDNQTRIMSDPVPVTGISVLEFNEDNSKIAKSEPVEELEASDEEDVNIPCIHLSDDISGLRTENSISSNGGFRGYTYETSSDEDQHTRGHHKVEEVSSVGKTGVQENNVLMTDENKEKAEYVEKVGESDEEDDRIPCIHLSDDISGLRNDNSISSNGDFCGYTYETSSDEEQNTRGHRNVEVEQAEHVEEVGASDEEDVNIPCIHLSDDISGLRNDNSISSNGDFCGYTYETSSDEEQNTHGHHKVEVEQTGHVEDVGKSDEEDVNIPCIHLSDDISGLRNDNSILSNRGFRGYTYETSSDEEQNALGQVEVAPSGGKSAYSDIGYENEEKAEHVEEVGASDEEDVNIPCIHLSDDISGLRNDNSISSNGDFCGYTYETSSDEEQITRGHRKVEVEQTGHVEEVGKSDEEDVNIPCIHLSDNISGLRNDNSILSNRGFRGYTYETSSDEEQNARGQVEVAPSGGKTAYSDIGYENEEKAEHVEEVGASDEEDVNIPCIHLSDDISGLRNDNSISSNGDFCGYTYETSSDEEQNTRGHRKVEVEQTGHVEEVGKSDEEDVNIPCIHLSDDISGLRNDNSILSNRGFRGYTYETSSDEEQNARGQVEVAPSGGKTGYSDIGYENEEKAEHVEEVGASDEEGVIIPCIHLSDDISGLRNDNSILSNRGFRGYTYETSSDEEQNALGQVEVAPSGGKSAYSDIGYENEEKAEHVEEVGASDEEDVNIPCIHLSDDISGLRNDNSISSNGDFCGYTYETSSDEEQITRGHRKVEVEQTGHVEEVGKSDEEDVNIPCIHLSDNISGLRNDNSILSNRGFRGYTYETSSDEEQNARGQVEVAPSGGKTAYSDIGYENEEKAEHVEEVGASDEEDVNIPCIHLSDDISGLRNDNSISSNGDFCGYTYETSSDEEQNTRGHRKVEVEQTGHVEEVGKSDEEDVNIPCIHLSDDISGLRNDNSILSNRGFRGYTYETSSDEEQNARGQVEVAPSGGKTGYSDIGYENEEKAEHVEEVGASDEEGVIIPCIHLSDDISGLRNDNSISSNEDFCGYTYETSSDEEQNTRGHRKVEVEKAKHVEEVGASVGGVIIPCIHLSDDISGLRNDNSFSSNGDFQDYSYESSSNEAISNHMEMASSRKLSKKESSNTDLTKVDKDLLLDPQFDTGPTEYNSNFSSIKDILCAPELMSGQGGVGECTPTPETSMRTTMASNFMRILMKEEDDRNTSHTHLNESNNSRDNDKSPRRGSAEQDNLPPDGALQNSSCRKSVSPDVTDDVDTSLPLELGYYTSNQTGCNSSKVQLGQDQYKKDVQQSHGDKRKISIAPADINSPIQVENVLRNTTNKSFTTKYLSKKKESLGSNVRSNEHIITNDGVKIIQKCDKEPTSKERPYTAKYLARCQTTAPLDPYSSSSKSTPDAGTETETACEEPQPQVSYRSRQFTAKYLSKSRVQEPVHPSEQYLDEGTSLRQYSNNVTSYHVAEKPSPAEKPKNTVIVKNRHFTTKYLTTRQNGGDLKDGSTDVTANDAIRCRTVTLRCESDARKTVDCHRKETTSRESDCRTTDDYHRMVTPHCESDGRNTSGYQRKETTSRDTDCSTTGTYHRMVTPRCEFDPRNTGGYQRKETTSRDTDCSTTGTYHRRVTPRYGADIIYRRKDIPRRGADC